MIVTPFLHSVLSECQNESATLFTSGTARFPTLSYNQEELLNKQPLIKEIMWIEGTVTVSF